MNMNTVHSLEQMPQEGLISQIAWHRAVQNYISGAKCDSSKSCKEEDASGKENNEIITERVRVPSYKHVANIVRLQSRVITSLITETSTFLKTPTCGEEPTFLIKGTRENVNKARLIIQSASGFYSDLFALQSKMESEGRAGFLGGCTEGISLHSNSSPQDLHHPLKANKSLPLHNAGGPAQTVELDYEDSQGKIFESDNAFRLSSATGNRSGYLSNKIHSSQCSDSLSPVCIVCEENYVEAALVPCGHYRFCYGCASSAASDFEVCPHCGEQALLAIVLKY